MGRAWLLTSFSLYVPLPSFFFLFFTASSLMHLYALAGDLQSSALLASRQGSTEVPSAAELVSAIEKLVKTKLVSL